jgi:hypothetical protein
MPPDPEAESAEATRLASLSSEASLKDLLLYYRSKISAFEGERRQYLQRLADLERLCAAPATAPVDSTEAEVRCQSLLA